MESNHWNTIYKLAEQYYKEKGNLLIPFRYTTIDKIQLGRWIGTQRGTYKKNKLSKDKIELLEKIGMVWDPLDAQWNECYELAKKYYKEKGNLLIPHQYTINNIKLGRWIGTQRGLYKDNNLSRERILLLENIGIDWNPIDTQWNECYEIAKKYYNKYGNLLIPTDFIINNTNIGRWVATQRANYKLGVLTNYKTELLEDIGMIWEPYDTQWKDFS